MFAQLTSQRPEGRHWLCAQLAATELHRQLDPLLVVIEGIQFAQCRLPMEVQQNFDLAGDDSVNERVFVCEVMRQLRPADRRDLSDLVDTETGKPLCHEHFGGSADNPVTCGASS